MGREASLPCSQNSSKSQDLVTFPNILVIYCEILSPSSQPPKLDDHLLLAIRDYLFTIFASSLHVWRSFP